MKLSESAERMEDRLGNIERMLGFGLERGVN
jgi:hypothetical protein